MDPVSGRSTELPRSAASGIEDLYKDTYRQLVRMAVLLLGDLQRSEEIVQDVFVDLFQRWDRLRRHDELAAYVKTAVGHAAISELRHRRVVERHRSEPLPEFDSAEVTALSRLRRIDMLLAIDRLPDRQRQVLILRYFGDLAEADIARALGISRGAVKSHSSRALRSLRPLLEATP